MLDVGGRGEVRAGAGSPGSRDPTTLPARDTPSAGPIPGRADRAVLPGGSYVIPQKGLAPWAAALAVPLVLLLAAVACVIALRKAVRRPRYRHAVELR
ncbi:hypothetical protein GCM10018781_78170 [Kitasatospora indigofera]|uniref:Uncharacterized protein n=1 Tax=Kitasatospora indigofera TaxID=67307 RepID=A0A918YV01_9ACTN|nr:hypothetical protein GCM10018781_78170 [Kitasatospora indigofera]